MCRSVDESRLRLSKLNTTLPVSAQHLDSLQASDQKMLHGRDWRMMWFEANDREEYGARG